VNIPQLLTEINERIIRVESLLDRGQVTPEELLTDMKELRGLTETLKDQGPAELAPHQQALLNLNAQLNSLQMKMSRARDGLGAAIVDIDKRRKALHNYAGTTKKKS
jgi:hypothetical protein